MAIEQLHPRFESVVAPAEAAEQKEILPFDKFVEHAAFDVLAALPFVEAWERALPEEDRAGADGFVKLAGLDNPLAVDVTVSGSPDEMKEKLGRIGAIYSAKVERDDARIRPSRLTPIKLMPLFLRKKDFADLYTMYAASPAEGDWHMSPALQQAVFHEFVMAVRRLYDALCPGNPDAAEREFRRLLAEWLKATSPGR